MKIVVIAPSPLREVVESTLSPLGHEVSLKEGKSFSLSLPVEQPADLIVLGETASDWGSGIGLCQLVRDNPQWARTPIFLVCSDRSSFDSAAMEGTVDRCFTAPFSPLDLLDAVTQEVRCDD